MEVQLQVPQKIKYSFDIFIILTGLEDGNIKMNLTVVICIIIAVATILVLQTDAAGSSFIMDAAISFGIQILPITRLFKSDEAVAYAKRKLKKFTQRY